MHLFPLGKIFLSRLPAQRTRPGCGESCSALHPGNPDWLSPSRICARPARSSVIAPPRPQQPREIDQTKISKRGPIWCETFQRMAVLAASSHRQNRPLGNFSIVAPVLRSHGIILRAFGKQRATRPSSSAGMVLWIGSHGRYHRIGCWNAR
jgi:hypothetical protein